MIMEQVHPDNLWWAQAREYTDPSESFLIRPSHVRKHLTGQHLRHSAADG